MCIVLLTTKHPSYALIVIDNRDEFILRPTSRPHWWTPDAVKPTADPSGEHGAPKQQQILSSRDLQRRERGTWLGVTRAGHFAVLTNYRESAGVDVAAARSRGAMVTAWLAAPPAEPTARFVERMLADGGVRGVGGFSLICGKLRRSRRPSPGHDGAAIAPLAVLSNRASHPSHVPWIAGARGETLGLSNTRYDDPVLWPKIADGRAALDRAVAAGESATEAELLASLFAVLDADTLPVDDGVPFDECTLLLKHSIFIRAIGDAEHRTAMEAAVAAAADAAGPEAVRTAARVPEELAHEARPDGQAEGHNGFATGMYGTQRQTVLLVDWEGNVTYVERALWDAHGRPVERGQGDMYFRFQIEGWDEDEDKPS